MKIDRMTGLFGEGYGTVPQIGRKRSIIEIDSEADKVVVS